MTARPLPRVVLSHTHDQGVAYRAALACQHLGLPFRLITGLYYRPGRLPYSLLGLLPQRARAPLEAKLRRRRLEGLDDGAVLSFGLPLAELSMRLTRSDRLAGLFHDRLVSRWLRRHAARGEWTIFHGYIGRCLSSLAAAKGRGMKALVEVTLPPTSLRFVAAEEEREGIRPSTWIDADEKAQLAELREADYVVAQNSYSVSELRRLGVPPGRIFLVPLGIDLERFRPAAKAAGPRPFRVLFVGQISIRKGLHHLLRAWRRLGLEDAELCVAGHVVDAAVAAELSRTPGTRWLGQVPPQSLPEIYRDADVLVCPSLSEGGPFVVLEALASGLPVIATAHAQTGLRDGIEGFVVPVGDVTGIAERIRRLRDDTDLRAALAANARQRALGFDWSARERRMGMLYRQILEGTEPPEGDCIDLTGR